MLLKFPNMDTFKLALTSGVVPVTLSSAPVKAGRDELDALIVDTGTELSKNVVGELKKLGVATLNKNASILSAASCWPELIPLQQDKAFLESGERPEQLSILFVLPNGTELASFAAEMLRLGNDRQSYRWLEGEQSAVALLKVVGPPYYTLLRTMERNTPSSPLAFVEKAPRVWVQLGWTHPLVKQFRPKEKKLLLLRPPNRWSQLDDLPFEDVYKALDFNLAIAKSEYEEGELEKKISVTPSLRKGGTSDGAEFWVLQGDGERELNKFVQNSDEQVLNQLNFAVGENKSEASNKTVIVQARQSRTGPPVLVLNAQGYRSFQKLPNLFVPVGSYLHPSLRRDVVRKMLAADPSVITWLEPRGDSSFEPRSITEGAFRPLSEWVDYVLDHDQKELDEWLSANKFDFESFVTEEEERDKPKRPPSNRGSKRSSEEKDEGKTSATVAFKKEKKKEEVEEEVEEEVFFEATKVTPSQLELHLKELENRFLSTPGTLDCDDRKKLWPKLAAIYATLGQIENAGVCFGADLWSEDLDKPNTSAAQQWYRAEAKAMLDNSHAKTWLGKDGKEVQLDKLLQLAEPSAADVRALSAYIIWTSTVPTQQAPLLNKLKEVQEFLQKHEYLLPIRSVWLAWSRLAKLNGGDTLALARVRDRLLERIFQTGLRPELDMPEFLRSCGKPGVIKHQNSKQWLVDMCEATHTWSTKPENSEEDRKGKTSAYINFLFAYGLGRINDHDACEKMLNKALDGLSGEVGPHKYLAKVFKHRVQEALAGKPAKEALPSELMEELEKVSKLDRYVIDRMRQFSRILEPNIRLDPYRHWGSRISDLDKSLTELIDMLDKEKIAFRIHELLGAPAKTASAAEKRIKVLHGAMQIAPRVGEAFSKQMLEQVIPTFDKLPEIKDGNTSLERAEILEKALFLAAHFDRLEHVQPFMSRFRAVLSFKQGEYAVSVIDKLAGRCLRGLRKVGMRDEIDDLLKLMAKLILGGSDLKTIMKATTDRTPSILRALLHVASGWLYFNKGDQAEPVLQAAKTLLLQKDMDPKEKAQLTAAYAQALGQAPPEQAYLRLQEIFTGFEGYRDNYTTSTYYSIHQLEVVEAVVLAIVNDDATLGAEARRWLDEDEFLVRQKIHKDMKEMLKGN